MSELGKDIVWDHDSHSLTGAVGLSEEEYSDVIMPFIIEEIVENNVDPDDACKMIAGTDFTDAEKVIAALILGSGVNPASQITNPYKSVSEKAKYQAKKSQSAQYVIDHLPDEATDAEVLAAIMDYPRLMHGDIAGLMGSLGGLPF